MKSPSYAENTSRLIDCKWATCAETLAVIETFPPPTRSCCPPVSYGEAELAADPGSGENQENRDGGKPEKPKHVFAICILYHTLFRETLYHHLSVKYVMYGYYSY